MKWILLAAAMAVTFGCATTESHSRGDNYSGLELTVAEQVTIRAIRQKDINTFERRRRIQHVLDTAAERQAADAD